MNKFRGDLSFIHREEGHKGRPYWINNYSPSNPYTTGSGITLDPGVDLGYVDKELLRTAYYPLVENGLWLEKQYKECEKALGLKGLKAKHFLDTHRIINTIRIGKKKAENLMSITGEPYWIAISERFPDILLPETPDCIHTVMLSLAYNRGAYNKHLEILRNPLKNKDWERFAYLVGSMQQTTIVAKRRRREAKLIEDWLDNQKPISKLEPKDIDDVITNANS